MARVLVIEDEPGITLVLTEVLTQEGHFVLTAPNGHLGLELLDRQSVLPDIIFIDLHMPGLSGKAVIETIHANPDLRGLPIVIMTGSIPSVEIMLPAGYYRDVLGKPFDLEDVLAHVGTVSAADNRDTQKDRLGRSQANEGHTTKQTADTL